MSVGIEEAHFAAEHIKELRQALDAGVPKEFPYGGWLTSPDRSCLFRIGCRRAEFQQLKTTTPNDAGLPFKEVTSVKLV